MRMRPRKGILIITCVLTVVTILVLYKTHRAVPFMMDDLWYSTMLSDETPITSFADIVKSQVWHYNNWGGRSITHGILQLTLLLGERGADILNVAVTFLLAAVACVVAQNKKLPAFWAALALMLGLNANWKMSMFWQAGAANYLYITVFILLFAWCYLRELPDKGKLFPGARTIFPVGKAAGVGRSESVPGAGVGRRESVPGAGVGRRESVPEAEAGSGRTAPGGRAENSAGNTIAGAEHMAAPEENQSGGETFLLPKPLPGIVLWILPLSVLAGWSNENMGPAVWLLSLAVIVLTAREGRRPSLWMILGNIGCLAGSILVIVAPGNFVRSARVESNEYGFLWQCFLRGYAESGAVAVHLFPVLLVLGFMAMLCMGVLKQELGRRNALLLLCALLSWGAMVLSPHYPDRATFGTMLLLICVILSLAKKVLCVRKDLAWMLWGITAFIWLRGMYYCGEFLAITWGWIK